MNGGEEGERNLQNPLDASSQQPCCPETPAEHLTACKSTEQSSIPAGNMPPCPWDHGPKTTTPWPLSPQMVPGQGSGGGGGGGLWAPSFVPGPNRI